MTRAVPPLAIGLTLTVIVRVSYGYGYTRGSGRVWVEIFGAGRVRVRVAPSATGTGRVAEMVDPHTPSLDPGAGATDCVSDPGAVATVSHSQTQAQGRPGLSMAQDAPWVK